MRFHTLVLFFVIVSNLCWAELSEDVERYLVKPIEKASELLLNSIAEDSPQAAQHVRTWLLLHEEEAHKTKAANKVSKTQEAIKALGEELFVAEELKSRKNSVNQQKKVLSSTKKELKDELIKERAKVEEVLKPLRKQFEEETDKDKKKALNAELKILREKKKSIGNETWPEKALTLREDIEKKETAIEQQQKQIDDSYRKIELTKTLKLQQNELQKSEIAINKLKEKAPPLPESGEQRDLYNHLLTLESKLKGAVESQRNRLMSRIESLPPLNFDEADAALRTAHAALQNLLNERNRIAKTNPTAALALDSQISEAYENMILSAIRLKPTLQDCFSAGCTVAAKIVATALAGAGTVFESSMLGNSEHPTTTWWDLINFTDPTTMMKAMYEKKGTLAGIGVAAPAVLVYLRNLRAEWKKALHEAASEGTLDSQEQMTGLLNTADNLLRQSTSASLKSIQAKYCFDMITNVLPTKPTAQGLR